MTIEKIIEELKAKSRSIKEIEKEEKEAQDRAAALRIERINASCFGILGPVINTKDAPTDGTFVVFWFFNGALATPCILRNNKGCWIDYDNRACGIDRAACAQVIYTRRSIEQ